MCVKNAKWSDSISWFGGRKSTPGEELEILESWQDIDLRMTEYYLEKEKKRRREARKDKKGKGG